jgi:hypothetical protein
MQYVSSRAKSGFSTIELLMAFSVGILFLTAAIMVSFSDTTLTQQLSLDSGQTASLGASLDNYAFATSSKKLGDVAGQLLKNWNTAGPEILTNTQIINPSLSYTNVPTITDISPCLKEIITTTSWGTHGRSLSFGTALGNIALAQELGSDCDPVPPTGSWSEPRVFSSHSLPSGKPVAIDTLDGTTYLTDDAGLLSQYNSRTDTEGSSDPLSITPYVDAGGKVLNDVDVANIDSHRYAFVTRHDPINQFQVIDVTTPGTYSTSSTQTLTGTRPPNGSFPQGWRVFYFDKRTYVTTRETAGSEFHIFDVSTPLTPIEIGPGLEINGTANDILVTSITINTHTYTLAFLATDRSANEIMVLNVTKATNPTLLTSIDLPTTNDALSLQLLGNTLYVGRQKTTSGPELFIYHIVYGESGTLPTISLTPVGAGLEVGTDIASLKVVGKFAYISNPLTSTELQIWDISHPTSGFQRVDTTPLNLENKIIGLDYESPNLFVVSQTNSAIQIITSAP